MRQVFFINGAEVVVESMGEVRVMINTAVPPALRVEDRVAGAVQALRMIPNMRRSGCMRLPEELFKTLCDRLLDRRFTVRETANWLAGRINDAPTRSAVDRFAAAFRQAFEEVGGQD